MGKLMLNRTCAILFSTAVFLSVIWISVSVPTPLVMAQLMNPEANFLGVQGYTENSLGIGNITDHTPIFNYTYYNSDGDSQYQRNISVYDGHNSVIYYDNVTETATSGTNITFEYPSTAEPLEDGHNYILKVDCNDTTGRWSSISTLSFVMNTPPRATLSIPYNGSINVNIIPSLVWNNFPIPNEDPATYFWYVNKSNSPLIVANGSTTNYYVSFEAEPWTTYYWRICAFDGYEWTNSTQRHFTTMDSSEPISSVETIIPYFRNLPLSLNISASDTFSGLNNITLYYKHSSDNVTWTNWTELFVDTGPSFVYLFSFPGGEGYYQLLTIATDNVSNVENKSNADSICCYDTTRPLVTANSPVSNANITDVIEVDFCESMIRQSVEYAFSMKIGSEEITGSFTWANDGKSLIFTPSSPLAYNSSYQVTIYSNATDLSGNSLLMEYKWDFTTRTPLSDEDFDEDNLSDQWELTYFDNLGYGANDDPDNDGYINLEEWQNNTDPNDPNSHPSDFNYMGIILLVILVLIIFVIGVISKRRE